MRFSSCMTQNFMFEASIIIYSVTKGISKYINSKDSNGSLKSFKGIEIQSYIHSYYLSMMNENDKNVPLMICDFHIKRGKRVVLSFFKRRYFKVPYLKF